MAGELKSNPGASPAYAARWAVIDWNHHRKNVERLQMRIAKAVKLKRWGKVDALQRILVTSYSAKLIAVKTVTSNKGKHTPGIDGILWKTPKAKLQAVVSGR